MSEIFENKIPIEKQKLVEDLASSLSVNQQEEFRYFAQLLEIFCKYKFSSSLEKLKTHYHAFNPDTESPIALDDAEEQYYARDLAEKFHVFLQQQNYQKISDHDILDILEQYKLKGVKIKIPRNQYRDLVVYFRDELTEYKSYRKWYTLWLKKYHKKVSYYKRMAVLFRPYRDNFASSFSFRLKKKLKTALNPRNFILPQEITLKLFKDINEDALPVLFPGISIEMSYISQFLVTISAGCIFVCLPLMLFYSWANPTFLAIIFISMSIATKELFTYRSKSAKYHAKLLDNFYYNSLNNNSGVISHLIENAEDEMYKQILLTLYAFWVEKQWAINSIHAKSIRNYIEDFVLKRFGTKIQIDVEKIAYQLSNGSGNKWLEIPKLIEAIYPNKAYIKNDVENKAENIDIEKQEEPIPYSGKVTIAPGTKEQEIIAFERHEYRLYINNEKNFTNHSHDIGSSVRWIPDQPIHTRLSSECCIGSDILKVFSGDIDNIPLKGIGKIGNNGNSVKFHYVRSKDKNELHLTTALRDRHVPRSNNPVMVRLVPPHFIVTQEIPEGTTEIDLPANVYFPDYGFIVIKSSSENQNIEYKLKNNKLILESPIKKMLADGSSITLVEPQSAVKQKLTKGCWLIPVPDTKQFNIRGILIVGANTKHEERVPYQRPVYKLELEKPVQFKHFRGSDLQVEGYTEKVRLIKDTSAGSQHLLVHGFINDVEKGKAIINPGENNREICYFKVIEQYLYLLKPIQNKHSEGTIVAENLLESSLKYEASQGSYFITLEDASSFPLAGTVQINFRGDVGIKEVHPFKREPGSNTLILIEKMDRAYPLSTSVFITAVESTTTKKIHYYDHFVDVDFSCVPNFPQKGKIIIEPGSQAEEAISFLRYPDRLHLKKPLHFNHKKGTALEIGIYPKFSVSEPLNANSTKILVENGQLLPDSGKILIQDDVVKYHKSTTRVLLLHPCRYYHVRGSLVQLSEISKNIKLAEYAEKGSKKIKVFNAQELPKKGKIEIYGFLHQITCEFKRQGDILYLKNALPYNFSTRATLKLPDLYLQMHLSPGMDYLEISDISWLPESGTFYITNSSSRRKKQKDEILPFRYCPDTLWLENPLGKQYPENPSIKSYDFNIKECGMLQASPLQTAIEKIKSFLRAKLLE